MQQSRRGMWGGVMPDEEKASLWISQRSNWEALSIFLWIISSRAELLKLSSHTRNDGTTREVIRVKKKWKHGHVMGSAGDMRWEDAFT